MLVVVQDVVLGKVWCYLAGHNVFHKFAYDTCEGNKVVAGYPVLLSFLDYWGNISNLDEADQQLLSRLETEPVTTHIPPPVDRYSILEDLEISSSLEEEDTLEVNIHTLYELYHGPTIEVYTRS